MLENVHIETSSFVWMIVGLVIFIVVPVLIAIIWKIKKKEPITSILIGAAAFMVFALILEKPIQNAILFPTTLGLDENVVSVFVNERPVLLAIITALFAGVFEETGRFLVFKSVLRNRKNRETSISYGIGHGGFEVIIVTGVMFAQYIAYSVMINDGTFQTVIDQVAATSPEQLTNVSSVVNMLESFSFMDVGVAVIERVFAVLFHIGASIMVFYACKNRNRLWLYPLAIIMHTLIDLVAALNVFKVISIPTWAIEGVAAIVGLLSFFGAYFLLYKKDEDVVIK